MASESDVKPEHSKLWHCHRTVSEMLRDRGYVVDDADIDMDLTKFVQKFESNDDVPEFRTIRRQELTKRVVRMDDEDDIMFVFFMEETNVGVKHLQIIMQRLTQDGAKRAILVIRDKITPFAKKVIHTLAPKYIIEEFLQAELQVNITQHVLVPEHILLMDEEKDLLLEKYHLKPTQLPRIQKVDPVARYFGLQVGQVVKIVRPSETAGRYVTYRLVM
eukprot:219149_1